MALALTLGSSFAFTGSALTSLTTSFSIDILEIDKKENTIVQENLRKKIHVLFSIILIIVILIFKYFIADESVIAKIFTFAGYTYGPLLGLYSFGLFTKFKVKDTAVPFICIFSPILTLLTNYTTITCFEFDFEFFVLVLNGAYTFIGLILFISTRPFMNNRFLMLSSTTPPITFLVFNIFVLDS